jgi:hypothetical protein
VAPGDDSDNQQRPVAGFQLHAQTDEIPLDLGEHVGKLIRGKVGGIDVERVGRAAHVLQHHAMGWNARAPLRQHRGRGDGVACVAARPDDARAQRAAQLVTEIVEDFGVGAPHVPREERGIVEGDLEHIRPLLDQLLPVWGLDIVRLEFQQHLGVQVQRFAKRRPAHQPLVAAIVVATRQIVVQPGMLEPQLEAAVVGESPDGVFVVRKRLAPTTLRLQLPTFDEKPADQTRVVGDGR